MNKNKAFGILQNVLLEYRKHSYSDLLSLIEQSNTSEIKDSNETYQISIYAQWDDKKNGNIRVYGAIDDGGFISSHFPLSSDFIIATDGSFIDE